MGSACAALGLGAACVVASPAAAWLGRDPDDAWRIKVGRTCPSRNCLRKRDRRHRAGACLGWPARAWPCSCGKAGRGLRRLGAARTAARQQTSRTARCSYRHQGSLATISRNRAVAELRPGEARRCSAWWLWGAVPYPCSWPAGAISSRSFSGGSGHISPSMLESQPSGQRCLPRRSRHSPASSPNDPPTSLPALAGW